MKYSKDLKYDDFAIERKNATVTFFKKPLNEGSQLGWSYKNLVTKDIGSDIYLAWILFERGGGHDYHAHSGEEILYILKGKVQFAYRSTNKEDVKVILGPGDSAYVPRGTPHSLWNLGGDECNFIVVKSPPYFLEEVSLPPEIKEKSLKP